MVKVTQIHSLTDFQRNTKVHLKRLKETGTAEVLTVNGQAEVIVQSPQAYQQLVDDAELARSLRVLQKSLEDAKAGRVKPAKAFLEALAGKYGIVLSK